MNNLASWPRKTSKLFVYESLAAAGVFRARWTHLIQNEWMSNLAANRPDLNPDALRRTVATMNEVIEDCLIEKFEYLIGSLTLPDPDERHVLAGSIVGHADAIVAFNLRDFPEKNVAAHGIEILHPDDFWSRNTISIRSVCSPGLRQIEHGYEIRPRQQSS